MKRISLLVLLAAASLAPAADRPNVLIVITDDQGFGDLGAHGNPVIKTPNLDAFARESVWLRNFYVSPVCSPTRSPPGRRPGAASAAKAAGSGARDAWVDSSHPRA